MVDSPWTQQQGQQTQCTLVLFEHTQKIWFYLSIETALDIQVKGHSGHWAERVKDKGEKSERTIGKQEMENKLHVKKFRFRCDDVQAAFWIVHFGKRILDGDSR